MEDDQNQYGNDNNNNQQNDDGLQNNMEFDIQMSQDNNNNHNEQEQYNNDFANNNNNDDNNNNEIESQQPQQKQEQYVYNNEGNNVLGDLNKSDTNSTDYNSQKQQQQPQPQKITQMPRQQQQQQEIIENQDKGGIKFKTCIATVIFKILAVFSYILISLLSDDPLGVFVCIVIFSAFDFWTVKNISGRLLVGLRWYSEQDEKGKETWLFESQAGNYKANKTNLYTFWLSQLSILAFWAIIFLFKLFSLQITWAFFILFPIFLTGINLYGYYKCRGEHQQKGKEFKKMVVRKGVEKAIK